MIYDTIEKLGTYIDASTNKLIQDFLKNIPEADGNYQLDGERVIAIIQPADLRIFEAAQYESHVKYIDIQLMIKGEEQIYYHPVCDLEVDWENLGGDIIFYHYKEVGCPVTISRNMFALYFPYEGHMPSIGNSRNKSFRKIIFKVLA